MFYDVKVLNPQGKVKKIISEQELSTKYWNAFYTHEANKTLNSSGTKQVPNWVKKKLDMDYAHVRITSLSA
ncbi:MAG: hypothetical protein HN472_05095 [Nitrospina sp.]|jgi:hypothetical protein|nr:hypothetical protein [Nitrospina sp.]MBT3876927.1 hypothetical protein [Nitrospina sp.]MBT4047945.1 hypothetical protein [Nitrospina sp.]MBT4558853.1 hypothetical protein [Nitrospina sp.]MBT5348373.1 hypothetical protein [Nitrospina sp.]